MRLVAVNIRANLGAQASCLLSLVTRSIFSTALLRQASRQNDSAGEFRKRGLGSLAPEERAVYRNRIHPQLRRSGLLIARGRSYGAERIVLNVFYKQAAPPALRDPHSPAESRCLRSQGFHFI